MISIFDKVSLFGMALGAAFMFQPWWAGGFRAGFFVTISCTVLQIITGHLIKAPTR